MIEQTEYKTINGEEWLTIKDDHSFVDILEGWYPSRDQYYKPVKKFGVAIQAGGYCGIFPHKMSQDFELVYTFEPDPLNFFCLARNCVNENVIKAQGALGSNNLPVRLVRHNPNNRGMITVHKKGSIPKYRIDDLNLDRCDLIQLDVEEYEIEILRGAEATLDLYRPVVVVENDSLEIFTLLSSYGYEQISKVYLDTVYAVK